MLFVLVVSGFSRNEFNSYEQYLKLRSYLAENKSFLHNIGPYINDVWESNNCLLCDDKRQQNIVNFKGG